MQQRECIPAPDCETLHSLRLGAAQARRGLRHFAADLAVDQAATQMVLTPETDRALLAEFVGNVGKTGTIRGGQN